MTPHVRAFPRLSRGERTDCHPQDTHELQGAIMLSTRLTTGIGGLFVVTSLLVVVQLYTGVQAFPL